jgi:hypothetical protein
VVGNTEVIQITEACDSSPGPPAAPSQFVFQPSVKRNGHGENGLERRERAVSGTTEAALALTTRKRRESVSRRKHSESVPDICLAPTGVLRGTGSWLHSSNPGRRVVKHASRTPRESALCWQFA